MHIIREGVILSLYDGTAYDMGYEKIIAVQGPGVNATVIAMITRILVSDEMVMNQVPRNSN